MIKNESYYVVQGWMRNRLHLKGNDLIVYALLYSFSQDGESEFKGSMGYITDFTGASRQTIMRTLERLEEQGLIETEKRNAATGLTNAYKCVPLDRVKVLAGGCTKMGHPPSQNGTPPCTKMGHPLPYIREDSLESIGNTKERKKEIKENNQQHTGAPAHEVDGKFSKMTIEQLVEWGTSRPLDLTDPDALDDFYAWNDEMEKRGKEATTWRGKIIANPHGFERLKSHDEVMTELGVSRSVRVALKDFLRHCWANRHLVTNDKLTEIICALDENAFGDDEQECEAQKCEIIRRAISGGFFDIKVRRR